MKYTDYICTQIDIKQYYDQYISPLNPNKFKPFKGDKLAVCPLHNDHDPSLGVLHDRRVKGKQIYHCFGCNRSGDVISLYQEIQRLSTGKSLSYQEAASALASLYGIEVPEDLPQDESYSGELKQGSENVKRILMDPNHYSPRDYTRQMRKLIASSKNMSYDEVALNLDALNIKLKQSKMHENQE